MEGPAGLVAKQLQQHVLTFLQGCKEIPRSLCAPPDAPDLPPKHSPPPSPPYVPAGPGGRVCGAAPPQSRWRRPRWGVAGPGTANTSTRGCGIEQRDRVEGSSVSLSACSLWCGKSPPCAQDWGPEVLRCLGSRRWAATGIRNRGSHKILDQQGNSHTDQGQAAQDHGVGSATERGIPAPQGSKRSQLVRDQCSEE